MRKLPLSLALVLVFVFASARAAKAGDPHLPGIEMPPPCECAEGSTATASGLLWLFTNGGWTLFM